MPGEPGQSSEGGIMDRPRASEKNSAITELKKFDDPFQTKEKLELARDQSPYIQRELAAGKKEVQRERMDHTLLDFKKFADCLARTTNNPETISINISWREQVYSHDYERLQNVDRAVAVPLIELDEFLRSRFDYFSNHIIYPSWMEDFHVDRILFGASDTGFPPEEVRDRIASLVKAAESINQKPDQLSFGDTVRYSILSTNDRERIEEEYDFTQFGQQMGAWAKPDPDRPVLVKFEEVRYIDWPKKKLLQNRTRDDDRRIQQELDWLALIGFLEKRKEITSSDEIGAMSPAEIRKAITDTFQYDFDHDPDLHERLTALLPDTLAERIDDRTVSQIVQKVLFQLFDKPSGKK